MRETNATMTMPHPIDTPSEYGPSRQIVDLIPSPTNPRKDVAKAKIAELIDSLRANGMLQPILARPWPPAWKKPLRQAAGYLEIVDGERRYLAAGPAGLERVPVIVRELTDVEVLRVQLISNREREEIHPLDEAEHYARYLKAAGVDADALAAELGMSRSHVYQRLQLQKLIDPAQTALRLGELTVAHGVEIARLTPLDQARAVKATIREAEVPAEPDRLGAISREDRRVKAAVSVRELKAWIATNIYLDLERAPFPIDDADLVSPKTGLCHGACVACPYNTEVSPELFADVARRKHGTCTNPAGYEYKTQGWLTRLKTAAAAEHGDPILEVSTEEGYGGSRTRLPKLRQDWQPAGALDCDDSRWAIVAHLNPYDRSEQKLGHIFRVCTAKGKSKYAAMDCKVHNKRERAAPGKPDPERSRRAKEQRKRRELRDHRATIYAAIFARDGQPTVADWQVIAESFVESLYDPAERQALGTLYGWTRPAKYTASKYARPEKAEELQGFRAALAKASDRAAPRLVFAAFLAGRVASNDTESRSDRDPLLQAARAHKVDVAKLIAGAKATAQAAKTAARSQAAQKGMAKRLTKGRTVKGSAADGAASQKGLRRKLAVNAVALERVARKLAGKKGAGPAERKLNRRLPGLLSEKAVKAVLARAGKKAKTHGKGKKGRAA